MGRTCAWCGTVIRGTTNSLAPVSHALCSGCLQDLRSALSANGLRPAEAGRQRGASH